MKDKRLLKRIHKFIDCLDEDDACVTLAIKRARGREAAEFIEAAKHSLQSDDLGGSDNIFKVLAIKHGEPEMIEYGLRQLLNSDLVSEYYVTSEYDDDEY